jgi:hypothetical protein
MLSEVSTAEFLHMSEAVVCIDARRLWASKQCLKTHRDAHDSQNFIIDGKFFMYSRAPECQH